MYCTDIPDPVYFIFSEFTPEILYYSHIPTAIAALMLGIFVISRSRSTASKLLLAIALIFTVWSFSDLILWTHSDSRMIMFVWSYLNLLQSMIALLMLYFVYTYLNDTPVPLSWRAITIAAFLPIIVLLPSTANLVGFDRFICEATEGPLIHYFRFIDIALFVWIVTYLLYKIVHSPRKLRIAAFGLSVVSFLLFFIGTNIFSSYTGLWEVQQYGLFGLPLFLAGLVFLILQYKAFNIRATGSVGLVVVMWVLIFSLLFVQDIETARFIVLATLFLTIVLGYIFILATRREVQQRDEIAELAEKLKRANGRLRELDKLKSEFVSIASHQLRSPLTSIRGYASMLLEGSYGKLTKKATGAISRIHQSSRYMALTVEDFLNVSRIEAGTMKYDVTDFDICAITKELSEDIMPAVTEKDLEFKFTSHIEGTCLVHADIGKTRQILQNLIDNAAKYTQKGSVIVTLERVRDGQCVAISVTDTGIGMSKETQQAIFKKFARAKNANKVNVIGSGLGLYVAREMAEQMGGTVTAESEGEGKGSTFTVRLPLAGAPSEKKKAE